MSMITIFLIFWWLCSLRSRMFTEPTEGRQANPRASGQPGPASWPWTTAKDDIVKQVTFSSMPSIDRFLRTNRIAIRLQLMLDQAKLPWTVGRFFFFSRCMMVIGAILGNWWIPAGVFGWIPGSC